MAAQARVAAQVRHAWLTTSFCGGPFVWYEWLLVSTVPRALLVRPCIVWRGSRSYLVPATSTQIRLDRRERHGALATLVCLRTHACREVQCCGGEVEERRSGGAEERR